MFEDQDRFEEMFRSMARELGQSVERAMERVDMDEIAGTMGVDPSRAKDWMESAGGWLRARAENLADEPAPRPDTAATHGPDRTPAPSHGPGHDDPLFGAVPHPLDLPTEEQGRALAALDSGRWTVEPGTEALAARGEGPSPSDALGLVRELRVRDWLAAEGEITLAGRRALSRWLEADPPTR
jgi:hypothetical protein